MELPTVSTNTKIINKKRYLLYVRNQNMVENMIKGMTDIIDGDYSILF